MDDDHQGVTLDIQELTTTILVGRLFGTLVRRDPMDPDVILDSIGLNMTFRSGLFDGSWPCAE